MSKLTKDQALILRLANSMAALIEEMTNQSVVSGERDEMKVYLDPHQRLVDEAKYTIGLIQQAPSPGPFQKMANINTNRLAVKERERKELQEAMERFSGQITTVPSNVRSEKGCGHFALPGSRTTPPLKKRKTKCQHPT